MALAVGSAGAQDSRTDAAKPAENIAAIAALPDSPGTLLAASTSDAEIAPDAPVVPVRNVEESAVERPARKYHRVVRPYEQAQPLDALEKVKLSIASRVTVGEAFGTVFSAGWSQWRNSRPHTGTDTGAFEERLRDLAIKQTTQSFFAYGVYAAAFRDDPRYYIMGPTMTPVHRLVYAAERTVITQKNDGSPAINWPKFAGIATATALTTAYYPKVDHGFGNESEAFAMSLATSVLNDELHEFGGDVFRLIRRNKDQK
ncbi:MAG TPA: hypothetical protein VGU25_09585 [Acidobacteriaceae bacterium]|nr:hypothetical protein [Acidobacteriaceae bacterium]